MEVVSFLNDALLVLPVANEMLDYKRQGVELCTGTGECAVADGVVEGGWIPGRRKRGVGVIEDVIPTQHPKWEADWKLIWVAHLSDGRGN